eukprot:427440-Prymnesium_polylepis.1
MLLHVQQPTLQDTKGGLQPNIVDRPEGHRAHNDLAQQAERTNCEHCNVLRMFRKRCTRVMVAVLHV